MNYFKQLFKSKTINFNALYLALIAALSEGFGVSMDPAVVASVQTILNFVLRHLTDQHIMDKESLL